MISICIPAYEMGLKGAEFLCRSLESIQCQSFTDYETIVSDHSCGRKIERLCSRFAKVRYMKNPDRRGNSSANLNNAIDQAEGSHIKIIFQDDFLSDSDSLAHMIDGIGNKAWLVHACWRTGIRGRNRFLPTRPHIPVDHKYLLERNTLGMPTAIMFKKCALRFDERLRWLMDIEFYFRMLLTFGAPAIIFKPLAVQRVWRGQLTHKLTRRVKNWERQYIRGRHAGELLTEQPHDRGSVR
jgi:hypothetical protein